MSAVSIAHIGIGGKGFARGRAQSAADRMGKRRALVLVRRVAVFAAALVCGIAILLCLQQGAAASEGGPAPVATTTVTVEEGQSLWSIASTISGGSGTDRIVDQIKELNGLSGSAVRVGETLTVPAN